MQGAKSRRLVLFYFFLLNWTKDNFGGRLFHSMYSYDTVSQAVEGLKSRGFDLEFNLEERFISCQESKFNPAEFEIVEAYRYEGNSDPGDEAVVYGIVSKNGKKGVLVTGYGVSSENISTDLLKKLKFQS